MDCVITHYGVRISYSKERERVLRVSVLLRTSVLMFKIGR